MALVGRSGAGKSTVIELISRFYDVQEGEVLIGGKNVEELDYDTILKNIAIVFQRLSSPVTVCWKISAWVVTLLWKKCGLLQRGTD